MLNIIFFLIVLIYCLTLVIHELKYGFIAFRIQFITVACNMRKVDDGPWEFAEPMQMNHCGAAGRLVKVDVKIDINDRAPAPSSPHTSTWSATCGPQRPSLRSNSSEATKDLSSILCFNSTPIHHSTPAAPLRPLFKTPLSSETSTLVSDFANVKGRKRCLKVTNASENEEFDCLRQELSFSNLTITPNNTDLTQFHSWTTDLDTPNDGGSYCCKNSPIIAVKPAIIYPPTPNKKPSINKYQLLLQPKRLF